MTTATKFKLDIHPQALADLLLIVENEGNAYGQSNEACEAIAEALRRAGWARNRVGLFKPASSF